MDGGAGIAISTRVSMSRNLRGTGHLRTSDIPHEADLTSQTARPAVVSAGFLSFRKLLP